MFDLMPFENAMCAFYDEPEILKEFLDALLKYKKFVIGKIVHLIQPRIQPTIRRFCSIPSRTPAAREEEVG